MVLGAMFPRLELIGLITLMFVSSVFAFLCDASTRATRLQAQRLRAQGFFYKWAAERGWSYDPSPPLHKDTPLLAASSGLRRASAAKAFSGLVLGIPGSIYEHSFPDPQDTENGPSFIVLRLGLRLPGIGTLTLSSRAVRDARVFDNLGARLSSRRRVELEAEQFNVAYELEADTATSDTELRRLFTPSAIERFLTFDDSDAFPGGLILETGNGVVIFAAKGRIEADTLGRIEQMLSDLEPFVRWLQRFASASAALS